MTKEELLRFKENYAAVNKVTIEEERRKTPEMRLKEMATLHRFGKSIGWRNSLRDEEAVRARWQKLREKLGVTTPRG